MRIAQKALIVKDGKYLVLLKSATVPRFPGYWDFPGGTLEEGEDPIEGVRREVLEETSLDIEPLDLLWKSQMNVGDELIEYRVYSARALSGSIRLSHEHTSFRWVAEEELLRMKVEPYMTRFFDEFRPSSSL